MTDHLGPGIYFGLPEDVYRAHPGLNQSGLKMLLRSPPDFWWQSPMNPYREEEEREPLQFGKALHTYVCEGREVFNERYRVRPERSDPEYVDLPDTKDDLIEWARGCSLELKPSWSKQRMLNEIAEQTGGRPTLWSDVRESWQEALVQDGALECTQRWAERIELCGHMIAANPQVAPAFKGGYPEVTVIWEADGILFKARFDYLKLKAVVDLKSFTNHRNKGLNECLLHWNIAARRYDIQARHYGNAREAMVPLAEEGHVALWDDIKPMWLRDVPVDARKKLRTWLDNLCATPDFTFVFVFYQSKGAPIVKAYQWDRGTLQDGRAQASIDYAVEEYRKWMAKFGTEMWVLNEAIHVIGAEELPSWLGVDS